MIGAHHSILFVVAPALADAPGVRDAAWLWDDKA
jgi:hypothetical protein